MSAENRDAVRKYDFDWGAIDATDAYEGVLHHMSGHVIGRLKAEARYA